MSESLYALAILACPVGMGLMMWLMMRGNRDGTGGGSGSGPTQTDHEIARLRAELDQLRAEARDREAPSSKPDGPR